MAAALLAACLLLAPSSWCADAREFRVSARGYGPVHIGMTVAEASAALGTPLEAPPPANGAPPCYYVAPRLSLVGVSFMVSRGEIARVDVDGPGIKTERGIGIDDSEERAREVYGPALEISPAKYGGEGDRYLTHWSEDRKSAVRFETYQGRITRFYAGRLPEVIYVEGCA